MSKFYLALFLNLFLLTNCNAQSEKETIDFLNDMFSSYSGNMSVNETTNLQIRTEINPVSNRKLLVFDYFIQNELFATYKFNGEHINSLLFDRAPNGNLYVKIISSRNLILRKYAGESDQVFESFIQQAFAKGADEEVQRIKKALIHLLKLNGAKFPNDQMFTK